MDGIITAEHRQHLDALRQRRAHPDLDAPVFAGLDPECDECRAIADRFATRLAELLPLLVTERARSAWDRR